MSRRYAFGSCEIDVAKRVLARRGRRVDVQAKVFDLLLYLIEHRDHVVSPLEILDALWPGVTVTPGALSRAVHKARQAVGDGDDQHVIATVHGRGFRFVAPLRRVGAVPPEDPASDFVGREPELSRLQQALERASAGRGGLVLVTGEPGIGKTRTVREFLTRADGAEVHLVRCPAESALLAYWPWRQLAHRLAEGRTATELEQLVGRAAPDFVQIEPGLADRVRHEPLPALSPEEMRVRLFEGAVNALDRMARDRPVVLAIDDLHQADLPSLVFLRFVAHWLPEHRVVVVATLRDAELDAEQIEHAHQRSGGNPFFLVELLLMIEQRGAEILSQEDRPGVLALPATVRAAVASHLARLEPETRRLLEVASVFGGELSLSELALASDTESDAALRALDIAVAAHVLEAVPGATVRFRFVHPLLRETLYDGLAGSTRARHHLRVAQALEASLEADPLVLAYHWCQAAAVGGASRAVDCASRAAELCISRLAFEAAELHLERALEALSFLPDASSARRAELLVRLGKAAMHSQKLARSAQLFRDALELGRAFEDPEENAALALAVARAIGLSPFTTHREVVTAALESLGPDHPALIEVMRSNVPTSAGDPAAVRVAREVVARARAAGDAPLLARALGAWHWVEWRPESWPERWEAAREIERLGAAAGFEPLLEGRFLRTLDALEKGDRAETLEGLEAFAAAARDVGHAPSRWRAALLESILATVEGRFANGEALASEAFSIGQRSGIRLADPLIVHRAHASWRGFLAGLVAPIEKATRQLAESAPGHPLAQLLFVRWLVERGELASARQRLETCAKGEVLAALDHPVFLEMTTVVASELKEERLCDAVRSRLLPHRGLTLLWPEYCLFWGPAARYLALASWGLRDWQAAEDSFEEARAMCGALLATTLSIQVSCDWARMLAERGGRGDHRAALGLLTDAHTSAARLRAPGLIEKCETLRPQISS